jgi:hypothetical protein
VSATAYPFAVLRDVSVSKNDFIARIGPGIHDKHALMREVGAKLQFPSYFKGNSWDAFSDWLRDLSWIGNSRILLLHEGTPHLPRKELLTYLSIAFYAIESHAEEKRALVVAFPEQTRALLDAWSGYKP